MSCHHVSNIAETSRSKPGTPPRSSELAASAYEGEAHALFRRCRNSPEPQMRVVAGLLRGGLCIHQILYFARLLSSTALAELVGSLSLSRSLRRDIDHDMCANGPCCKAYNVDESHYETRHVEERCGCDFIEVPYTELCHVIKDGRVPLISIQLDTTDEQIFKLKVESHRTSSRYVAVSHVWFDGLGNPHGNALPRCQIRRLYQQLTSLFPGQNVLLWFDTLCIPVSSGDHDLRAVAIDSMGSIYQDAQSVLVLDAKLLGKRFDARTVIEDIVLSAWMSRSWTLQEGALADTCVFQFADAVFTIYRHPNFIWGSRQVRTTEWDLDIYSYTGPYSGILQDVFLSRYSNINDHQSPLGDCHVSEHQRFVTIWNTLAARSTSKAEDQYLILANMLDLDCQSLHSMPEEKRISSIILGLKEIPLSILFSTARCLADGQSLGAPLFPLEIGNDPLSIADQTMRITRSAMELDLHYYQPIDTFLINTKISLTSKYFAIDSPSRHKVCLLPRTVGELQIPNKDIQGTCLIMDRVGFPFELSNPAALFYIVSSEQNRSRREYSLVFACPARVCPLDSEPVVLHPHQSLVIYDVQQITSNCTFKIKYERPRGVKPLRPRKKAIRSDHLLLYFKRLKQLAPIAFVSFFLGVVLLVGGILAARSNDQTYKLFLPAGLALTIIPTAVILGAICYVCWRNHRYSQKFLFKRRNTNRTV